MKGGARIVSGFDRGLADSKKGCWVVEGLDDMGSCGCEVLAGRENKFLESKADVEVVGGGWWWWWWWRMMMMI